MARIHRLDPEHGIHHVYSRGTRRWTLFIDDTDYEQFLLRLSVVCARFGISVYSYCLMGNHFHLVIYCPHGQLSTAMRDLKSFYARQHNDRHGFSGPLFEARFGSKLVHSMAYMQVLIRYIHRNPLAISSTAPLGNYPWSSHPYFLEPALPRPVWLATDFPRSLFGDARQYAESIEGKVADSLGHRPPLCTRIALSSIMMSVATAAGCDMREIRPRRRNGLAGLVVLLASDREHYTSHELSDACGFTSPQGTRNAKRAVRQRLKTDAQLRAIHDDVVSKLW